MARTNDAHVLMLMVAKNNTILTCKMHCSVQQFNSIQFLSEKKIFHTTCFEPFTVLHLLPTCFLSFSLFSPTAFLLPVSFDSFKQSSEECAFGDALEELYLPFLPSTIHRFDVKQKKNNHSCFTMAFASLRNFISRKTGATC